MAFLIAALGCGRCYIFRTKGQLLTKTNGKIWANLKRKKFSTSSKNTAEDKPNNDPQSYFELFRIDEKHLNPKQLVKPFYFTLAFSTASILGAAIWHYENTKNQRYKDPFDSNNKFNSFNRYFAQVFLPICIANILVFLAWKVPQLEITMIRYFCSNPGIKNNCWPMVLSTFSHFSFLHLFTNMFTLQSFSSIATMSMGKEQLLGFYLAAAVISSFASYAYKVVTLKNSLSLGASGAIMGVLGYSCVAHPNIELSILFLPFFSFKAGVALKFIMGLDIAGMLLGWKVFDHAAHIGGAMFGIFWAVMGKKYIWDNREAFIKHWRKLRKGN